ncbi:MAG TPA: stage II sporulation protein M [Planctomycetaceae bacterium]|nr:stage II sporulation protein M [Planctomycetaceae bacterium]
MNKRQFVARRRQDWEAFEKLLEQFRPERPRSVESDDVSQFSRMYREICQDLSLVQSRDWGKSLTGYLNDLVTRGHNTFYRAPPTRLRAIRDFVVSGFPRVFRRNLWYFVTSCLLFFGPLAVTWILVQSEPELARRIVSLQELEQAGESYQAPDENSGSSWRKTRDDSSERLVMAGFYTQHNISIAFDCFGRGILLGIGTAYTLLYNGIAIGAMAGYLVGTGRQAKFLTFVISHGAFELVAIAVAGGAGLILGHALLHPGRQSRMDALWERGRDAIEIAVGAGGMLLVAALIEAFWSPSDIPDLLKVTVGILLWILVTVYLTFSGRWEETES